MVCANYDDDALYVITRMNVFVFQPERILAWRRDGELIAVREIQQGKHLIVVYPEHADDGFVITAFITSKARSLAKRRQVWP